MEYQRISNHYLLRLDKGEELVATLKRFCAEKGVRLAHVHGIGATNKAVIGLFKTGEKEYAKRVVEGDHEIASLNGTVTMMNGEPYPHLHAVLGDEEQRALAGHLNSAVISATCELVVEALHGEVAREPDEEVGLNLLWFREKRTRSI